MVELGERIDKELPVRSDHGAVLVHLRHLVERVAGQAGAEFAEIVMHRRGVPGVEVDPDEALPHLDLHAGQSVVGTVEVEELLLLLHEGEFAIEGVPPPVVLARELATRTADLFARIVLPHQLVAAVPADVVERPDLAVGAPHHDDGRAGRGDLAREVAAHLRQLLHAADVEPRALEDRLAFELEMLG